MERTILRYNELVAEGYRTRNMTQVQEVATEDQATKLFYHMAAIGEGRLRMDSTLRNIKFVREENRGDQATVETREIWDFTQYDIASGKKFYEEKNFVYSMGYELRRTNGRWQIVTVNTISGESTNNTVSAPPVERRHGTKDVTDGSVHK